MMGICFSVYSTSSSFFQCNRENEILFISFGTHDANNLILVSCSTSNNIVLLITKWPEDKITIIVHVTDVLAGVPQPMGTSIPHLFAIQFRWTMNSYSYTV